MTDKFEYKKIKSKLITIKDSYNDYLNAVNNLKLVLKTEMGVSPNSALFNAQGDKIIKLWDSYGNNLDKFIYVFEKWIKSTVNKYNNIIKYEKRLGDNLKITNSFLISPITYKDKEIKTLSKLLSGDKTIKGKLNKKGNESIKVGNKFYNIYRDKFNNIIKISVDNNITVIHNSQYENNIKDMYNKYKNRDISKEEWNNYKKELTQEEKEYLDVLTTNSLAVNTVDVISILDNFELLNNDAEDIAKKNEPPKNSIIIDDEIIINTFLSNQQQVLETFIMCGKDKLYFTYDNKYYENNSYIEKIPYKENNIEYYKYLIILNGEEIATYDNDISIKDYLREWHKLYPKFVIKDYSKKGIQEYNEFNELLEDRYQEYKDNGIFYLDFDKTIYYKDKEIYYEDNSILNSHTDDLNWYKSWIIDIKDQEKIKDLFMIANGYIKYKEIDLYQ